MVLAQFENNFYSFDTTETKSLIVSRSINVFDEYIIPIFSNQEKGKIKSL